MSPSQDDLRPRLQRAIEAEYGDRDPIVEVFTYRSGFMVLTDKRVYVLTPKKSAA